METGSLPSHPDRGQTRLTKTEVDMKYAPLVGRILFAAVFVFFGAGHLTATEVMVDGGMVPSFLPFPTFIVIGTGIAIILAGLAIAAGYKTKQAALFLLFFLLGTSILIWGSGFAAGEQVATGMFLKDFGLAGAALMIYHFGPGPMSMDAKNMDE